MQGLSVHEALNHCGHTVVGGDTGHGELFIAACSEAIPPPRYQARVFTITSLLGNASTITRNSHAYSCENPTTIDGGPGNVKAPGFNFAMGSNRSEGLTCRQSDSGESVDEKVTYRIATGNSSFLARWRHEDEDAPDVGATAEDGVFTSVGCNEPAAVCKLDAPEDEDIEYCYAIMDEDGIEEWGSGSQGCGGGVMTWGMGGTSPSGSPAVVRVAKDRNSDSYYDFEIRTDKDLLTKVAYISNRNLVFRTSNHPIVAALSDSISVFGDWGGSTFYVEGWRWPAYQGR